MTLQDIAGPPRQGLPELEIEVFVHGAMCMSVSGRCLLSNYMAGRDANRVYSAPSPAAKSTTSEETRPGQLAEIGENENGSASSTPTICVPPPSSTSSARRAWTASRSRPRQDVLLRRQRDGGLPRPRPVSGRPG